MWNDKVIEAVRRMTINELDLKDMGLEIFNIDKQDNKSKTAKKIIEQIKHLRKDKRQNVADYLARLAGNIPNDLMMTDNQLTPSRHGNRRSYSNPPDYVNSR